MLKAPRYLRLAFDKEGRQITRHSAARLLWRNRRYVRRLKNGFKFIHGFEPDVVSTSPIEHQVYF